MSTTPQDNEGDALGIILGLGVGIMLGIGLGGGLGIMLGNALSSMLGIMLGGVLGGVLGIELSDGLSDGLSFLGSVLSGVLGIVLSSLNFVLGIRDVSRKRSAKAIETPDGNHPPQFAEYLLYFLPKTMREPLLGDLEEEYREVYARFGKRKATTWYYIQVGISYWPLLYRVGRKLVKWGVLGWIGGAVRRLIS